MMRRSLSISLNDFMGFDRGAAIRYPFLVLC